MSLIVQTKRRPPVAGWIWNARRGTARWTALDIRTPTFRVEEVGRGPAIRTRGLTSRTLRLSSWTTATRLLFNRSRSRRLSVRVWLVPLCRRVQLGVREHFCEPPPRRREARADRAAIGGQRQQVAEEAEQAERVVGVADPKSAGARGLLEQR